MNRRWLLFFYSVPAKPVSTRMMVWRKLAKSGAVQLKGAVYILPYSEGHYELLQWLANEVVSLKGDADFTVIERFENIKDAELTGLVNGQREKDYKKIERELDEIERKISGVKKGTGAFDFKKLSGRLKKLSKGFEEFQRIDFFASRAGIALKKRISEAENEIRNLSGYTAKEELIINKRAEDYRRRTWVTRKGPFVDRIASAWLVKKFIDNEATFRFIQENEAQKAGLRDVLFDIKAGEFTHTGGMCTFEVLLKCFRIKDKALKTISEIVHELDLKDGVYAPQESRGIEEILRGIRKSSKDDSEILERGMEVFEFLYSSKT
ncbi:MAG: chromate resistance protein [Nitrospirae bacterium]|nr:chromate resistance protein [Nitrospirota bacterium]